jgi:hypothetical protein
MKKKILSNFFVKVRCPIEEIYCMTSYLLSFFAKAICIHLPVPLLNGMMYWCNIDIVLIIGVDRSWFSSINDFII